MKSDEKNDTKAYDYPLSNEAQANFQTHERPCFDRHTLLLCFLRSWME